MFDTRELAAIDAVLGARVPVAAPKAILGETLGAGGAMGIAAALAWLDGAPPAVLLRGEAPREVRTVLVTSMGFYGNASAVIVRRPVQETSP
jgi:3-oxoacyl-[acyl-carrier-protein] synthase II